MTDRLDTAIEAVLRTLEGSGELDDGFQSEFVRGQINLLAEMFPIAEMPTSERMDELLEVIREEHRRASGGGLTLYDHIENVLQRSDIVWPKYGMATIQQLTAEIVQVVRDNTTYEGD